MVVQGSGKTLAFGLPLLNFLVSEARTAAEVAAAPAATSAAAPQPRRDKLRALVLCPTRELAMQVCAHLTAIAKPLALRIVAIVGGVSAQKQDRLLRYRPPVVVATPGRLWDMMRGGVAHVSDLTGLAFLVLDEADRMVKQGHYEELTHILARIPEARGTRGARAAPADDAASAEAAETDDDVSGADAGAADAEDGQPPEHTEGTVTAPALDGPLQTLVFSATLTLPEALKARLQRGHGGSRGSAAGASFESLMERMAFRGKPKVCASGAALCA